MREPDEPAVGCVLGGPGFCPHFIAVPHCAAQSETGSVTLLGPAPQHVGHQIGRFFAEHLPGPGRKFLDEIAVFIFDTGYKIGACIDPVIDKGAVCAHQLIDGYIAGAETEGGYRIEGTLHSEIPGIFYHRFGSEGLHQKSRD